MYTSNQKPARIPMFSVDSLTPPGRALDRPECVLCTARRDVYVAYRRGGAVPGLPPVHRNH
jgi:hypothetical protein